MFCAQAAEGATREVGCIYSIVLSSIVYSDVDSFVSSYTHIYMLTMLFSVRRPRRRLRGKLDAYMT